MIGIIDLNDKKLAYQEFIRPITQLLPEHLIAHYTLVTKSFLKRIDKVILSGTTLKDVAYLEDIKRFFWIKDFQKPLLGICAGMQIMAMVYGAKTLKCTEIGMTKIKVMKASEVLNEDTEAYSLHNYSVSIPKEFEILAKSKKSPQLIKHKTKPMYGVLFHPEVRNIELINKFLKC